MVRLHDVSGSGSSTQKDVDQHLNIEFTRKTIDSTISQSNAALRSINMGLHSNPETSYKEFKAHTLLTDFLTERGFNVTKHAYGLETAFEAEVGQGGHLVIFCAEYDALPDIGHACGHNLIATSSFGAFLGAVEALRTSGLPGRLRLLGTPAEEGGGGKAKLIEAGAFVDKVNGGLAAAAIMAHPCAAHQMLSNGEGKPKLTGLAGMRLICSHKLHVEFRGKTAHAGGEPWNGVNALDAAVSAYNNISLMRQQIQPDERIHGVFEVGGTVPNVITDYTRMNWYVRSPTLERGEKLLGRVKACFEAAALATGCTVKYTHSPTYADLRVNRTLCKAYVEDMAVMGESIQLEQEKPFNASTDMGNVSHILPSFHGGFVIPADANVSAHNPAFAACAGTDEAHEVALRCSKGMAMMAMRVLGQRGVAEEAAEDFQRTMENGL